MIDLIFDCAILFGIILIYVKLRGRMSAMEARMETIYSDISYRMALNVEARNRIDSRISMVATTLSEVREYTKPKLEFTSSTICVEIPDGKYTDEKTNTKQKSPRTTKNKKKNNSTKSL